MAGDRLLWELRVPGGNGVASGPCGLDATNVAGAMYGRVSYFHVGGIDKPLLITKVGAESVVPRDTCPVTPSFTQLGDTKIYAATSSGIRDSSGDCERGVAEFAVP